MTAKFQLFIHLRQIYLHTYVYTLVGKIFLRNVLEMVQPVWLIAVNRELILEHLKNVPQECLTAECTHVHMFKKTLKLIKNIDSKIFIIAKLSLRENNIAKMLSARLT